MASSSFTSSPAFPSCSRHPITVFPPEGHSYFKDAKIKIWWDSDTAPLPDNVEPINIVQNILDALQEAGYKGSKIIFWGRVNHRIDLTALTQLEVAVLEGHPRGLVFPSRLCGGWYEGRGDKDGVSRAILMDVFQSERRLTCPVNHLLISGHELFKRPLSVLKDRGHNILLARPPVASDIFGYNVATTIWNWNDLAQGKAPLFTKFIPDQECESYASHNEHSSFCQIFIPNPEFGRSYVGHVDPVPYGYEAQKPYDIKQYGSYVGCILPGSSGNQAEEDYNTQLGRLNLH